MTDLKIVPSTWAPQLLSALRIVTGFLFLAHGSQKLFNFPGPLQGPGGVSRTFLLVAGSLEFFGGLLILLGLLTRVVAFILSGMMAVAYFTAHAPQGFWPLLNRGELAALYSFVFLYLAAAGGGLWSLDNWLRRGKA